ncbi:MAG: hypothetical protein JRJ00_16300 [Deltaproteobacteria bacterium]|nr:hypothetical protein [Deltaproteobacteria bacterium]
MKLTPGSRGHPLLPGFTKDPNHEEDHEEIIKKSHASCINVIRGELKVEKRIVKYVLITMAVFLLGAGVPLISQAGEEAVKPPEEKAAPVKSQPEKKATVKPPEEKAVPVKSQPEKKATLNIKAGSGNTLNVDLTNSVPVRGMQFTISGVNITEVRMTKRTAGFLAKFNEKNGTVIVISTTGDNIAPGKGLIAEVICDKPGSAQLSGIKMAGSNREQL